jgi:CSLREA domain-containing protein
VGTRRTRTWLVTVLTLALLVTQMPTGLFPPLAAVVPPQALAASFVVTTTNDPGDGTCDGTCSLRDAIAAANAAAGADSITFAIPGLGVQTIQLTAALPAISDPVTIDATTQGNWVVLDGTSAGATSTGLAITSGNTSVRGFVVQRFGQAGIGISSGQNVIAGNRIGTTADGLSLAPNAGSGIVIVGSSSNTIGGSTIADRNVISGNGAYGVEISGGGGNTVLGNYIGVGADGRADVRNEDGGVSIASANNVVRGNVISANNLVGPLSHGVFIGGAGAFSNVVAGNLIGPAADGTRGFPNAGAGIFITDGASNNTIGGVGAADRNVISGNSADGVRIASATSAGNLIQGNFIGLEADGQTALGNGASGVSLTLASGTTMAANSILSNTIAANAVYGIAVQNAAGAHVIQSNVVGLAADGITARPNLTGVYIYLGETPQDAPMDISGNTVSGNSVHGMYVYGVADAVISNNRIGLTAGRVFQGNGSDGIAMLNSAGVIVEDNQISGNAEGIVLGLNDVSNVLRRNNILNNSITGILVNSSGTVGNFIQEGSISGHSGKGIALAGGAHAGIQPPSITDIAFTTTLIVSGTAAPSGVIQVYADPSDEGITFLGSGSASEIDGSWTIGTWVFPDMQAVYTAVKAGSLRLRATQTTSDGTSEFSAQQVTGVLTGLAACLRDIGDEVVITTTLPNTTVTLLSGSTVIATTQSDADATFSFTGLAPNAPLTVLYAGTVAGVFHTCSVDVTTDATGGGVVPEADAVINLGNHTWLTAYEMTSGSPVFDVIDRPFRRTFYKLTVGAQEIVTVQLTDLTRNYQLLGYSDIRAAADALINSTGSLPAVQKLVGSGAVSAGDLDSGDLDSGDLDSGDLDSGDLDSGDLDSGDLDSGDLDSGDLDSGDLDSGDLDSGDLDSGDLDSGDLDSGYAITYQSAQRAALRYASGHAGTTPEGFTIHTRGYSGDLYFAVVGHDGAFDSGGVFQITATATPESAACALADLTRLPPSPVPWSSGKATLILTNTLALDLSGDAKTEFLTALNTFAGGPALNGFAVNGQVYDLDSNANVKTMLERVAGSPECVPLVNLATDTIKALIWGPGSFRAANPSAQYVVFAGGDHAIPFRRITDLTFAGEINYSPPVGGTSGASLANNYYLTDSFYLAASPVERVGQQVWLTELSGGRLVETPTEILKNINVYTARGGVFTPTSSLVAGYQFNTDLVDELEAGLQAGGANPVRLPDDVWGATDIRDALLAPSSPRFDVIAPQAHYTATRLIPADNGQRVLSSEVADIADARFEGTVWLTIGCHSGYNIIDADAIQPVVTTAFPEAILRKGGFLYGGTGYQFGDDEILANTELLLTNVMNEWRYRQDASFTLYAGGQVPLGKALSNARNSYFNGLRSVRDIDRKVADVATFYGLPFYRVVLGSGRVNRPSETVISTTATGTGGLSFSDVVASFTLTPHTGSNGGIFYDAGPRGVTAMAARPILPSFTRSIAGRLGTAPTLAHGAVLREATYTTAANTPVLAMPQTEDTVPPPSTFHNAAFSPWLFDLNVLGGQSLVFTPAQYLSDPSGTSGLLRRYSSISTRVYYSTRTDPSALLGSPLVRGVTLTEVNGRVHVDVTLFSLGTSTIQAAMFTYTGTAAPLSTMWRTVDLVGDAPIVVQGTDRFNDTVVVGHLQHWHTVAPGGPAGSVDIDPKNGVGSSTATVNDVFGVAQAVGDTGDVVVDTNQMRLHSIPPQSATTTQPKIPTALAFTTLPASPTTYGASVSVAARLTSPGVSDMHGRRVIFRLGRSSVSAITANDGSVSAIVPVNVLPGEYQLRASFAEDATALGSSIEAPLVVEMASTIFESTTNTATVQYSDNVRLAALRTLTGQRLRWQPITLSRTDLPVGDVRRDVASYTDGVGDVRLDTMDFGGLAAGTYPVVATFAGDGLRFGAATSGVFMVTVQKELATIEGPSPQQTGSVTFRGTVVQEADRAPGDLTRAGVSYVLKDEFGATIQTGTATVAPDGTWIVSRTLAPGLYTIVATITGDYFTGSGTLISVVYDPTTFGTGGGYVLTTSDTVPFGVVGRKVNFGFNVKYKSDGTMTPTGSLLLQLKEANIDIKATSFDWLSITADGAGKRAEFQGRATLNGSGSYTFRVIARDLPSGDTLFFEIEDAGGAVVLSVSGPVGGGNIKVH